MPSSTARSGALATAAGQSRRSSLGGPGSTTNTHPSAAMTRPGAVPATPITSAPSGIVACFVTPAAKSAYGRFSRSAIERETPSIRRLEVLVHP